MNTRAARITATYRLACSAEDADRIAQAIAFEQTVEMAPAASIDPQIADRVVGRVESVSHRDDHATVRISYAAELADRQLGQLINLAYGSVSYYRGVRLTDLRVPDDLANAIGGPQFGIQGVREAIGIHDRPLLCTVLKPRGSDHQALADLAYRFASGGGDLLKDDQNLAEADFGTFRQRVDACLDAVNRANDAGGHCLYLPHAYGAGPALHRRLEYLAKSNVRGVVMCPHILGLETAKSAAREYGLIYLAHPLLAGSFTQPAGHGIDAAVLLGLFTRLGGADIGLFPGPGGRLSMTAEAADGTQRALTRRLAGLHASLPASGGGKSREHIAAMIDRYGRDFALVAGSALQRDRGNLTATTQVYIETLAER